MLFFGGAVLLHDRRAVAAAGGSDKGTAGFFLLCFSAGAGDSAGRFDAQQLAKYGLAYLKELHEESDPRFTGC